MDSGYESLAKKRRYGKSNLDQCSGSEDRKSDGKVRVFKRGAASDCSAVFKEAVHTRLCA